jgi:hypothetical protein
VRINHVRARPNVPPFCLRANTHICGDFVMLLASVRTRGSESLTLD